jgi:hypothetical protein
MPKSSTTTAQVDYTYRQHPPGPDLVPNEGRTAKISHRRRSAAAGAELRRPPRCSSTVDRAVESKPSDLSPTRRIRSRIPLRPEPSDRDLTAERRLYRFGLAIFLKNP